MNEMDLYLSSRKFYLLLTTVNLQHSFNNNTLLIMFIENITKYSLKFTPIGIWVHVSNIIINNFFSKIDSFIRLRNH